MASLQPKRPSLVVWLIAGSISIFVAVLGVVANLSQVIGYSLKDVFEAKNAEVVDKAARFAYVIVARPVPLWTIPASCFALWVLLRLRPDHEAVIREIKESLDRQRDTTGAY